MMTKNQGLAVMAGYCFIMAFLLLSFGLLVITGGHRDSDYLYHGRLFLYLGGYFPMALK